MGSGAQDDVWGRDIWEVVPKIMCRVEMYV